MDPFYVCLSYCLVCSLQPCDHLLGKADLLALFYVMFSFFFCHFPIWCPGSGVVRDCINSCLCLLLYFVGQLVLLQSKISILLENSAEPNQTLHFVAYNLFFSNLTLKAPRKKIHMKMSSAEVVCCK